MNNVTDKYKSVIESFSADLQLAKNGFRELKELDELIEDNNEKLLTDIDLLDELDYNLRNGNIILIEFSRYEQNVISYDKLVDAYELQCFVSALIKRIAKIMRDNKEK